MKTLRAVQLDPRLTNAHYDNAADHTINRSAEPTVVVLLTKVADRSLGFGQPGAKRIEFALHDALLGFQRLRF
jgi:hypothetical protein